MRKMKESFYVEYAKMSVSRAGELKKLKLSALKEIIDLPEVVLTGYDVLVFTKANYFSLLGAFVTFGLINALYWIKKNENWATFIFNRVKEIRTLTDPDDWNRISGQSNPADLPSRGCSIETLAKSNWWHGPSWLQNHPDNWPKSNIFPNERESFTGSQYKRLQNLQVLEDVNQPFRIRTRLSLKDNLENFKFPIVLPSDHPIVEKLAHWRHCYLGHAGVQIVMTQLIEEFWILKLRKTVRKVIRKCIVCKGFASRPIATPTAPLPVYRLRAAGLFHDKLDGVAKNSAVNKINWKFIPPSAPWWGGFWERLIGILKRILRKVLGRTSLNFEQLNTVLCDCKSIINGRPLTYASEDISDLVPLTPSMFLQEFKKIGVPDLDQLGSKSLNKRFAYRQRLRQDFVQKDVFVLNIWDS
ncbi:uncharacterized protein [Parasteatoda tepidariorum]|uniref:uncharacterized protein n=1 Tax=Parasteatoda tepidariorum TaxID=114398 RepID=UPI0039BC966F